MTMLEGYTPIGIRGVYIQNDGTPVECQFFMPKDYYKQIDDDAPWILDDFRQLEQLINVRMCGGIFRGLNREGHENSFCYSCRPAMAAQSGVLVGFVDPPPLGAFAGPILFGIGWRDEDENEPGFPQGWEADFGGVVWRRQEP